LFVLRLFGISVFRARDFRRTLMVRCLSVDFKNAGQGNCPRGVLEARVGASCRFDIFSQLLR